MPKSLDIQTAKHLVSEIRKIMPYCLPEEFDETYVYGFYFEDLEIEVDVLQGIEEVVITKNGSEVARYSSE